MLSQDPHPLLDALAFCTVFPRPLGESPEWLLAFLQPGATAPFSSTEGIRGEVRDLLRQGGFKPTGRSKPASEYLIKAVEEQRLGSINLCVDACNVVSLHSGLPISVVDLSKARPPFRLGIAATGSTYIFNASGQSIDIGGLLCLHEAEGPCANAVKDAQRTKTDGSTEQTLTVIWGTQRLPGYTAQVFEWYRSLLERAGASVERVDILLLESAPHFAV